jgi:hypothetical protein
MVKPFFICFAMCFGASAVLAQQPVRDGGERSVQEQPREADAQKRRADLRAALQLRPDGQPSSVAGGGRQLSQQERDELRQQLRQQRR